MKTKVIKMIDNQFRRKLTSNEVIYINRPSSNVIIAGTLNGHIVPLEVQNAIQEIQNKYVLLRVKIERTNHSMLSNINFQHNKSEKTKNVFEDGKLVVERYDKNGKLIRITPPG